MSPQEAGHGPRSHCIIMQGRCQWDSRGSGTPSATHPHPAWGKAACQPELFAFGGPGGQRTNTQSLWIFSSSLSSHPKDPGATERACVHTHPTHTHTHTHTNTHAPPRAG